MILADSRDNKDLVPQPPEITDISYECKNEVRVAWTPQSKPISLYRVFLDAVAGEATAHRSMNTTKNEVILRYRVLSSSYALATHQETNDRPEILAETYVSCV